MSRLPFASLACASTLGPLFPPWFTITKVGAGRSSDISFFRSCSVGSLLLYGVLQERIMTQPYGEGAGENFKYSVFLVLCNRLVRRHRPQGESTNQ